MNIGLLESLALQVMLPNVPEFAGWTPVGTGVPIPLDDLETDSKHEMLVRAVVPVGADEVAVQFRIAVDLRRTIPLQGGIYGHHPGISRGTDRGFGTAVLERDSAFTVSGTGAGSLFRPAIDYAQERAGIYAPFPGSHQPGDVPEFINGVRQLRRRQRR